MKQVDNMSAKWSALPIGQRIALLVAVLGVGIGGYIMYQKANTVPYSVLYANVDDTTASSVLAQLDAKGIPHRLDGNGTRIMVPTAQLATTRLAMASAGVSGQTVPKGFDEIFSNQGLASSDFEQRVNYERALEGELARTLLAMEPVAGASVQLSLPQQSVFIGDGGKAADKPTASVLLSLRRGLSGDEIDTVANMIASSVEGLTADQVTIASTDGALLRAAGADTSGGSSASSAKNIDAAAEYETRLSTTLTDLARTLSGQPGAKVEVRATMDFTESTVEHEVIDPTNNSPSAQHTVTEDWTGTGVPSGGTTGVDGGPIGGTTSGDGTYAKKDETITYVTGDHTVTKSKTSTPTVTRLSVAVVVPVAPPVLDADGNPLPTADNATPVDEAMLSRVIGSAAGIDTARGDTIEVAMVPTAAVDPTALITNPNDPNTLLTTAVAPESSLLGAAAAAGAFGMLLIFLLLRRRRKKKDAKLNLSTGVVTTGKKGRKGKKGQIDAPTEAVPVVAGGTGWTNPDRGAVEEMKGDLEKMMAESPESLAALLSSWMAK